MKSPINVDEQPKMAITELIDKSHRTEHELMKLNDIRISQQKQWTPFNFFQVFDRLPLSL